MPTRSFPVMAPPRGYDLIATLLTSDGRAYQHGMNSGRGFGRLVPRRSYPTRWHYVLFFKYVGWTLYRSTSSTTTPSGSENITVRHGFLVGFRT